MSGDEAAEEDARMTTISISRNDDEATVDFNQQDGFAGASRLSLARNVPFARIGAEAERLVDAGHVVRCTGRARGILIAAGADLSRTT